MAEEATVAAAPQGETENVSNTNTNVETTTEAPQQTSQPEGNFIRLTDEQMKFFTGQGMKSGDEFSAKAFEQYKKYMSNPESQPKPAEQAQAPEQQPAQPQQQPTEQPQRPTPKGVLSQDEINTRNYFYDLANREEYKGIADDIRNGEVLKDLQALGIDIKVEGGYNDARIRQFLDLKAKTVPTTPQQTPAATNIPTVEYHEVGDKVESREDAEAIIRQSLQLRAAGQPEHPKMAEARQFMAKNLFSK